MTLAMVDPRGVFKWHTIVTGKLSRQNPAQNFRLLGLEISPIKDDMAVDSND